MLFFSGAWSHLQLLWSALYGRKVLNETFRMTRTWKRKNSNGSYTKMYDKNVLSDACYWTCLPNGPPKRSWRSLVTVYKSPTSIQASCDSSIREESGKKVHDEKQLPKRHLQKLFNIFYSVSFSSRINYHFSESLQDAITEQMQLYQTWESLMWPSQIRRAFELSKLRVVVVVQCVSFSLELLLISPSWTCAVIFITAKRVQKVWDVLTS